MVHSTQLKTQITQKHIQLHLLLGLLQPATTLNFMALLTQVKPNLTNLLQTTHSLLPQLTQATQMVWLKATMF